MTCRQTENSACQAGFRDRRKNRRLNVHLDIVVQLRTPLDNPAAVDTACTHDVSPGDTYFESTLGDTLKIGDVLDLDIELPAQSSTLFTPKRLATRGRVVRIGTQSTEDPTRLGVAVEFLEPLIFQAAPA